MQDILPKCYTAQQSKTILKDLASQAQSVKQEVDRGTAVVALLQALLTDAACKDPTTVLLQELMLPIIRQRLEAAAGLKVGVCWPKA